MTAKNEYLKMQVDILRHILWSLVNLLFYPIVTVITNLYLAYRLARYSYRSGMLENSVLRKCNEAVLESMPQLWIQLMILLVSWPSDDSVTPTQLLSIITSLLSLSSGCASWFCFTNGNDKPGLLGTFSITFIFTLILILFVRQKLNITRFKVALKPLQKPTDALKTDSFQGLRPWTPSGGLQRPPNPQLVRTGGLCPPDPSASVYFR